MRKLQFSSLLGVLFTVSCALPQQTVNTTPTASNVDVQLNLSVTSPDGFLSGALVTYKPDFYNPTSAVADPNPAMVGRYIAHLVNETRGASVRVDADGFKPAEQRLGILTQSLRVYAPSMIKDDSLECQTEVGIPAVSGSYEVCPAFKLDPVTPPLPPIPTRDQVLSGHVMFQGLTCDTKDHGVLPWFDAGLFSLSEEGRWSVYQCKHAAGDTEAQLLFDNTTGSIYNENDNPYFDFQSRDFEHHLDQFASSVLEAVQNGFIVKIYLGGENYDNDMREFPIAHDVLSHAGPHGEDLNHYVKWSPGYDGVFYGWEPSKQKLEAFGRLVRSICPDCYLTMEFNTGHLPQEAGIDMSDYDGFDIEFGDKLQGDNNTYGILERLIGPAYNRPADDVPPNDGGDGHPRPWVLKSGTPRGPWYTNCFEWNTYLWVRSRVSAETVEQQRQWLRSIGCGAPTVPISQFTIHLRPAA